MLTAVADKNQLFLLSGRQCRKQGCCDALTDSRAEILSVINNNSSIMQVNMKKAIRLNLL